MFGWLKHLGTGVSHVAVSTLATNCWRGCVKEMIELMGAQHHVPDFWQGVICRFGRKWEEIHPSAASLLETRCAVFWQFLDENVLRNGSSRFTAPELEQIGEFVAVSIVRDFKEAILADAERASLVIDLLPRAWFDAAGLDPEKFDDWYLKMTGKHRVRRE